MRLVVTGGAGFVGSNLAFHFKRRWPDAAIVAFDNLRRRGSELIVPRLKAQGVEFIHGDVRDPDDVAALGRFDTMIESSAEPSVHAGLEGSPMYVLNTNLLGTINCLEAARRNGADFIFLSTSRVYPIKSLRELPLVQAGGRLVIAEGASGLGWSERGITGRFPLGGARSLYGATKLASELLIEEYGAAYGLRAVVNRCGVLTGPWQMGKVDQGFTVLWAARHLYGGVLSYSGFGGHGSQVRDLLHVRDLCELVSIQLSDMGKFAGQVFNVGGGQGNSVSLSELTDLCRARGDCSPAIRPDPITNPADIPYYVTDNSEVSSATGWSPAIGVAETLDEIFAWIRGHRESLAVILG